MSRGSVQSSNSWSGISLGNVWLWKNTSCLVKNDDESLLAPPDISAADIGMFGSAACEGGIPFGLCCSLLRLVFFCGIMCAAEPGSGNDGRLLSKLVPSGMGGGTRHGAGGGGEESGRLCFGLGPLFLPTLAGLPPETSATEVDFLGGGFS